jgi:hypothetical protein
MAVRNFGTHILVGVLSHCLIAFDNALEVNKRCTCRTIVFPGIYIAPMSRVPYRASEYGGFTEKSKYNSLTGVTDWLPRSHHRFALASIALKSTF